VFWDNTCDHVYEEPDAARPDLRHRLLWHRTDVTGAISATLSVNFLESVIKGVSFAADSALEQRGFEPPVPP